MQTGIVDPKRSCPCRPGRFPQPAWRHNRLSMISNRSHAAALVSAILAACPLAAAHGYTPRSRIEGEGKSACYLWTAARQGKLVYPRVSMNIYMPMASWAQGYVSAAQLYRQGIDPDAAFMAIVDMSGYLDRWCGHHPDALVEDATRALVDDLAARGRNWRRGVPCPSAQTPPTRGCEPVTGAEVPPSPRPSRP